MAMEKRKPNVVYILADDMGYGDLSCLNAESKIRTENLDEMARCGMKFTDAHSSSAVCTPSRYSIMTGRYNWRSTLKQGVLFGYDEQLIETGRMTVASYLKGKGYSTACIGKWHLGWKWSRKSDSPEDVDFTKPIQHGPITNGFDYFYGIAGSLDMPPYVYVENDLPTAVPDHITENTGKQFWRSGPTAPDFVHEDTFPNFTRRACDYIRDHKDEPFFLYFPLPAPHTPILPIPEFQGKSGTNSYGDFCLMVDDVVGQVRKTIAECGLGEDTIVIFTSDNGCSPMADFAELAEAGHNPSYIFRGHKADIYEGGHRIPLLVEWPSLVPSASTCGRTVCLSDLLATLSEYEEDQLPDDAGEDSVSNLPLWKNPDGENVRDDIVHHSIDGSFSIRKGRWKLELCPGSGGWSNPKPGEEPEGAPPMQLYDLDADIGERRNEFHDHPEVVAELTETLSGYVRNGRSTPGSPQRNTGPLRWPQLNWLSGNC